jgi:hypothetical protein
MKTKTRRKIRNAPTERPEVKALPELSSKLRSLASAVGERIISLFKDGNLPNTAPGFAAFEKELANISQHDLTGPIIAETLRALNADEGFAVWAMGAVNRHNEGRLKSGGDDTVHVLVAGGHTVELQTPCMIPKPAAKKQPGPRRKRGGRGKGGARVYAVLAALGFTNRVSPHVASITARVTAQLDSYAEAVDMLKEHGVDIDANRVQNIMRRVGKAGLFARENGASNDPNALVGKRVMVCIDGGRLRYRFQKGGRRRASGYHGFEAPWREPKLVVIYTVDENGKKTKDKPIYDGTLAPWEDALKLIEYALTNNGAKLADKLCIAADGSNNIWRNIEDIIKNVGIAPSRVRYSVDFFHALEHLNDAAKLDSNMSDAQRKKWVDHQAGVLKRGGVQNIIDAILALSGEDRSKIEAEAEYFRNRIDKMQYSEMQDLKWPVGTGAIESAVRRIVNLRLKKTGTFWTPESAECMLYLRCRLKAGRWNEVEAALQAACLTPDRDLEPVALGRAAA